MHKGGRWKAKGNRSKVKGAKERAKGEWSKVKGAKERAKGEWSKVKGEKERAKGERSKAKGQGCKKQVFNYRVEVQPLPKRLVWGLTKKGNWL